MKTRTLAFKQTRFTLLLAGVVFGFGSTFCMASPDTSAGVAPQMQQLPWKAVAASGPVANRPSGVAEGAWQKVVRGDELRPLSMLKTGRKGRTTLTRNASIIIVDRNSLLQLPAGGARDEVSRVVQSSGSVIYEVERGSNGRFEVVTPYLVAGVKGTVFGVTVTHRYALVSVKEGVVEVRSASTGKTIDVRAGESVLVDPTDGEDMEVIHRDAVRTESTPPRTIKLAQERLKKLNEMAAPTDSARDGVVNEDSNAGSDPGLVAAGGRVDVRGTASKKDADKGHPKGNRLDPFEKDPFADLEDLLDSIDQLDDSMEEFNDMIQEIQNYVRDPTQGGN